MKNATPYIVLLFTLFLLLISSHPAKGKQAVEPVDSSRIDTFIFMANGKALKAKVFLPAAYADNKDLPAIFLIDYTEQHFKLAKDEFEKVIEGVQQIKGFDALVVSLANIPDIDAEPETFKASYEVYKNMSVHVNNTYTTNITRTFIGKGSEGGMVLMALFMEDPAHPVFTHFIATDPSGLYTSALIEKIESNNFPQNKRKLKLHFSFSTSNDRVKCMKFIEALHAANYPWLQLQTKEYTTSNYENTYPVSFAEGLKYIFEE